MMTTLENRPDESVAEVPFKVADPLRVPVERYYDRDFYELEKKKLWLLAWLNACRHRGVQLGNGTGRMANQQIVCPFHGWRWDIDGSIAFVYGKKAFEPGCVSDESLRLPEIQVDTWAGIAWVNMDPDAGSLADYLAPVAAKLEAVGFPNMRVMWWGELIIHSNWKTAQEAFHETWHVIETHPQLTLGAGEDYPADFVEYTTFAKGHASFQGKFDATAGGVVERRPADDFIERSRLLAEGLGGMTTQRDLDVFIGMRAKVAPGEDFPTAAIDALFDYWKGAGIPVPERNEGQRLWGGECFIFPNFFVLPQYGNAACYRIRPHDDDPEWCRFEIFSLTTYPEGHEPSRARLAGRYEQDDAEHLGLIPRQDVRNIEKQQRGFHSLGFREQIMATEWESPISNMHQELDRYLSC
jgi:phenylpropionate dioxygenase-like ring-hydroxylating dioxygenase large terminal subunit